MRWSEVRNYTRYELEVQGEQVIYKEWHDSGRDPNCSETSLHDLDEWGGLGLVAMNFGSDVVAELRRLKAQLKPRVRGEIT